jgi:hypothetical protein
LAISNDAGHVKGVLILFLPDGVIGFSSLSTPVQPRGGALLLDA